MMLDYKPNSPGCFRLNMESYRKAPGLSASDLSYFVKCPLAFRKYQDGEFEKEDTRAMQLGRLMHSSALENRREFVVMPDDINLRTKEGKAWRDAQTEPVVTQEEAADIQRMTDAVWDSEHAAKLILGSEIEASLFAEYGGRWMKGRADVLGNGYIADLKTVSGAGDISLTSAISTYGWHRQAALYWKLCQLIGVPCDSYYIIAVEKSTGLVNVVDLADWLEPGLSEVDKALAGIAECEQTNSWPDYTGLEVKRLPIPFWMREREQIALTVGSSTMTI